MRELVCVLYIIFYTLFTAPKRLKYRREVDEKGIEEGRKKIYKMAQTLSKGILKIIGADVQVKNKENLPKSGPAVYMGTHKSYLDIVTMISLIDDPMIFIGKDEVRKIPFINTWFKDIGGIYMDRDDIRQSFKVIIQGIEELKKGYSVAIFPEGTRSISREISEFKAGSFKLATKANVPIVPIAMQDTFKLLEEKKRIQPSKVYVNIGKVIDVPNLTKEQKQTISKDTQLYVKQLLEDVTVNI